MAAAWVSALERTPVSELLQAHHEAIDRLREELASELQAAGPAADDVWLLRYVLSFDRTDAAADAARRALEWRSEHSDLIEAAKNCTAPPGLTEDELRAIDCFVVSGFHGTTAFGDPLFVIRPGASNISGVMDAVGEESMALFMGYLSECAWQRCEALTRARGFFVKQITLQDFTGTALQRDSRFFRVLGKASKTNEWLRPQLLGRMIFFNTPSWMSLAFRIASNFVSRKTLAKVWVHTARTGDATRGRTGLCPYAQQLLGGPDSLPSFLGGLCSCPASGGCINGMANGLVKPRSTAELQNYRHVMRAVRRLPPLEGPGSFASGSYDASAVSSATGKPRLPTAPSISPQASLPAPAPGVLCCRRWCGRRRAAAPPLLGEGSAA